VWMLVVISLVTGAVLDTSMVQRAGFEGQHACMKLRPFTEGIYAESHAGTPVRSECRYIGSTPIPRDVVQF
jgi:hypothetical protein